MTDETRTEPAASVRVSKQASADRMEARADAERAKRWSAIRESADRMEARADAERAKRRSAIRGSAEDSRLVTDGGRNPEDSFSLVSDEERSSLEAEFPLGGDGETAAEPDEGADSGGPVDGESDTESGAEADSESDVGADGTSDADPDAESGVDADGASDAVSGAPGTPTNEDGEVEPVELLVQLAREGEIEPWDIDIVAVTDAFLERLDAADLRTSGRALFYASVLLRMKSDVLLERPEPEPAEDEFEPWEEGFEAGDAPGFDPIAGLEAEMERRLERKPQRGSPETLDELVRDLREAERGSWWKESRTYDTSQSPHGFQRGVQELDYRSGDDFRMEDEPTEQDALGTAHQEDIEETIADVQAALDAQYDRGRAEVLFEEIADAGGSRVQTFLALLFLAHRGAVELEQDELFGDLWVVSTDAERRERVPAVPGSE